MELYWQGTFPRTVKAAFLAWLQDREGRYELTEGRVMMMVGASRAQGILMMNLAAIMRAQRSAARLGLRRRRKTD
jgi:hypothetical protein